MSFIKRIKQIIALSVLIITTSTTVANAQFYSVPDDLTMYGEQIYASACTYFDRSSFSGYCGTYVKCQLRAMGIFEDRFDCHGNGNQWYSNFENITRTSGGYSVCRESGSDCIEKLQAKYGSNLKNIVLSFPIQAGYTEENPGAGHAFVIYEIRDGIAYYSESFGFGQYEEGQVIAEDVASMIARYERRHGPLTGCVMLTKNHQPAKELTTTENEMNLRIFESVIAEIENLKNSPLI